MSPIRHQIGFTLQQHVQLSWIAGAVMPTVTRVNTVDPWDREGIVVTQPVFYQGALPKRSWNDTRHWNVMANGNQSKLWGDERGEGRKKKMPLISLKTDPRLWR